MLPFKHVDIRLQEGDERAFLLLSRVEPMVKAPPMPSSLTGTFLVCGGSALGLLLLLIEFSGTSSTVAQHSEEVRLPEWAREDMPGFFFPPRP